MIRPKDRRGRINKPLQTDNLGSRPEREANEANDRTSGANEGTHKQNGADRLPLYGQHQSETCNRVHIIYRSYYSLNCPLAIPQ